MAIANRFVWIVKKLKKFPGLNVGNPWRRLANWYVIATTARVANPSLASVRATPRTARAYPAHA